MKINYTDTHNMLQKLVSCITAIRITIFMVNKCNVNLLKYKELYIHFILQLFSSGDGSRLRKYRKTI